jgi:hypothetical protein
MSNWMYGKKLPTTVFKGQDSAPRRYYIKQGQFRQEFETGLFLEQVVTSNEVVVVEQSVEKTNALLLRFT